MGQYRGHRIPDYYDPEYAKQEGMPEYWYWYQAGYEDGISFAQYKESKTEYADLIKENEGLRGLLAANVRVMKAEIKKEIEDGGLT